MPSPPAPRPKRTLSLRSLLLLSLGLVTLVLVAGSLWIALREGEARAWDEARASAQTDLARLVVVAARMAVSDPALLDDLVALRATDARLAHAVVVDPDNRIVASTQAAMRGQALAALPEIDLAWLAQPLDGGQARVVTHTTQGRLVLSQAFAWPAAVPDLRGPRQGRVLLQLDLRATLAQLRWAGVGEHLWQVVWLMVGALLVAALLERAVLRPLRRLSDAAQALGRGEPARQVPPARTAELQAVGDTFNRMSASLADTMGRLADSEQRHREAFASAPDAMLTVSPDGVIDSFNAAAEQLFGHAAAAVVGQPLAHLLPTAARAMHGQHLARFATEGRQARRMSLGRVIEGLHRDGHVLMLEVGIARAGADGRWHFTAVARDVGARLAMETELARHRHQLEAQVAERTAQLARSRDEAQAATRAKSEFLANMSHEIRTPMNAIIGLAHLMRRDASGGQRAYLHKLDGAARHLLEVLNHILDFSKIEAGKLTLTMQDFELDQVIDDVCHLVSDRAAEKGLEVVHRIAPGLPLWRHGDDLHLRQVLINLLGNAVKFTEAGHVSVRVAAGPGAVMRFEVADTGIGIGEADRARIFQPFEQADGSASRRFGGTGLGLAICRALVSAMGGTLTLAPGNRVGSCFRFELPLAPGSDLAPAAQQAQGPPAAAVLQGQRVLVADDLAEAREVLTEQLRALGLRVEAVADGEQALQRVAQADADGDPFTLCLIDWQMPGLDGLACARRLRALPLAHQPAQLLATAFGPQLPDALLQGSGLRRVLDKPITLRTLQRALTEALTDARAADAAAPALRPASDAPEARLRARSGLRLLLVEDNALNQEVTLRLLQDVGLHADLAGDGLQALARVKDLAYDLVLMDVQMPRLDGLAATRAIRALPGRAALPILAMTAGALSDDRAACLAAGMNDVITKPVEPSDLYATLLRWLPLPPVASADLVSVMASASAALGVPTGPWVGIAGLQPALGLRRVGGNPALYGRVLRTFAEHHRADVDRLRAAARQGDTAQIARLCHALKGVAGSLGADDLATQATRVEALLSGPANPQSPPAIVLPALTDAVQTLADQLEALVAALALAMQAAEAPITPARPG